MICRKLGNLFKQKSVPCLSSNENTLALQINLYKKLETFLPFYKLYIFFYSLDTTMIAARAQELIEMTSSQALGVYERYVLPRIKGDKKNLSYIGSAVAATLLYTLYRKICLPPVALRKVPRLNMLTYVISVLKGTNAVDQLKSLYAPLIKQTGGFYVVSCHRQV